MNKRGITMETIVIAILCLAVLFILIFVFRSQISGMMSKYTDIAETSEKNANNNVCGGFFSDTKCSKSCSELGKEWQSDSTLKCADTTLTCCKKA